MTVILDNASIHHAKRMQTVIKLLEKQGITLYFLPAYSPELNCIETLGRLMKYSWLTLKQRSAEVFETDTKPSTKLIHIKPHSG